MAATAKRVLTAIESDSEASRLDAHWETRCIHCRSRLIVGLDGTLHGSATLEHIIPRSWFGQSAARELCARLSDADDPRNLALACARCNHDKGTGPDSDGPRDWRALEVIEMQLASRDQHPHDSDGPSDWRALEVIEMLIARRELRWRALA